MALNMSVFNSSFLDGWLNVRKLHTLGGRQPANCTFCESRAQQTSKVIWQKVVSPPYTVHIMPLVGRGRQAGEPLIGGGGN